MAGCLKISDAYSSFSNSPEVGVDEKLIRNVVSASTEHEILVLKPVIDKIKLSINGKAAISASKGLEAHAYWTGVYQIANSAVDADDTVELTRVRIPRYKVGARVSLPGGLGEVVFATHPWNNSNPAMTLEFNPSRWKLGAWEALAALWHDYFDLGNLPLATLLHDARLTRLDIAYDVVNLDLADLFVHHDQVWKTWLASSMTGGVETQNFYLAQKSSPKSPQVSPKRRSDLVAYDKRLQLIAQQEEPTFGPLRHVRIERQFQSTSLFRNLPSRKYPLKGWQFRRAISKPQPFESRRWRMFLDSARMRGYDEAAGLLDEAELKQLAKANQVEFPDDLIDGTDWALLWDEALERAHMQVAMTWASEPPANFLIKGALY